MVAGPDVYICDRCINDAAGIVRSDIASYQSTVGSSKGSSRRGTAKQRLTPHEIKVALDEYVIGQDQAKKALSVAPGRSMATGCVGVSGWPAGRVIRPFS